MENKEASIEAGMTRSAVQFSVRAFSWWFKFPVKLFRPSSVNPWAYLQSLALVENKKVNLRFIAKQNKKLLLINTAPLVVVNGMVGACLFHVYFNASTVFPPFISGCIAGMVHGLLATPLENLQRKGIHRMHVGVRHAVSAAWKEMPQAPLAKLHRMYRGLTLNMARDALSFSLFFGIYESLMHAGRPLLDWVKYANDADKGVRAVAKATLVIGCGSIAGAGFHCVVHPITRISHHVTRLKNKDQVGLSDVIGAVRRHGLRHFYNGISKQWIRVMPPSALALLVYEWTTPSTF